MKYRKKDHHYRCEDHHYRCEECNITFPTAPKGTCPNGHENFIAIGWLLVESNIRDHWFRQIRGEK